MSSRLEELYEKTVKHPDLMTEAEAMELQALARSDRAIVGKKTARKVKAAGKKGAPKLDAMGLEALLANLKKQQTLQIEQGEENVQHTGS